MPPTTIIDTAYGSNKQWYYALESGSLWRGEWVRDAGVATWTQCLLAMDGETFHRVVCQSDIVYVLCSKPNSNSNNDAFLYKSLNNGQNWTYPPNIVAADIGLGAEYTLTHPSPEGYITTSPLREFQEHTRYGEAGVDEQPWGMAKRWSGTGAKFNNVGWEYRESVGMPSPEEAYIHLYQSSNDPPDEYRVMKNKDLSIGEVAKLETWFDAEFGAGVWVAGAGYSPGANMPNEAGRVRVGYSAGVDGTIEVTVDTWVFWNEPQPVVCTALAVAPSSPNWVYVGFEDYIVRSMDGGEIWEELSTYGAYDIAVDPFNNSIITFWTPDGELRQIIDTTVQPSLLSETPLQQARRIAYDTAVQDKIFVLSNTGGSCDLKLYTGGAWVTKQTGIAGAAGLRVYRKGLGISKVMYLSSGNIYYSEDDGTTVASKKGGWSTIASPVSIDLL